MALERVVIREVPPLDGPADFDRIETILTDLQGRIRRAAGQQDKEDA